MNPNVRTSAETLLFVSGFLALLFLTGAVFIDRILFLPQAPSYGDDPEILRLPTANGETVAALYLPHPEARHTLLYSHGNAEDLGHIRPVLEIIRAAGFSVFAYDYQGYGTSTGRPSTRNAYRDIRAAYDYLTGTLQVPPETVVAHGRSLGGGPSAYLASTEPLGGLILESTFLSVTQVVLPFSVPLLDRFPVAAYLEKVRAPVLVIHGTEDEVIAFRHGRRLYERAPGTRKHYWVEGAGHNDLVARAGANYSAVLREFSSLLAGAAARP